jgi:ABC-type phosphate transport system permease subunit
MISIKKQEEIFFKVLMIMSLIIIMSILFLIVGTIIYKGLPALNWDMLTKLPGGGFYLGKEGGVLNAIIGSVYLILVFHSSFLLTFIFLKNPFLAVLFAFHLISFSEYHLLFMVHLALLL